MAAPKPEKQPGAIHHRAEELASGLPPLLVAAERVASTVFQGVHGRRRVGQGETFWQFRRYQPGDSASAIDWRQSAKSQSVYVRETEWEAAQSVWLWRDPSASMEYRSGNHLPLKAGRADLLMLALASLLVRAGEHLAVLGSGRSPMSGRAALNHLAALVEGNEAGEPDAGPGAGLPAFEPLPRYARVVLIGDFLAPLDDVGKAIQPYASHGVRGHMVQILDPAEVILPFQGRVKFEGVENDGDVIIGKVEAMRRDYRSALTGHRRGLESLAQSAGWTFATHRTDHSPQTALMTLYMALSQPTTPSYGT